MKQKFISAFFICLLILQPALVRADDEEVDQVTEQLKAHTESTDKDIFDQIADMEENATVDEAHVDSDPLDTVETQNSCLSSYEKRHKKLIRKGIVNAVISIPSIAGGTVAGAYGGSYMGSVLTGSQGYGAILGSAWGAVIMFYGASVFFTTREVLLVTETIQIHRMVLLLKEIYSDLPLLEMKILNKMQTHLKKSNIDISLDDLRTKILELDQKRSLCNGTMRRKKLVGFSKLRKSFVLQ